MSTSEDDSTERGNWRQRDVRRWFLLSGGRNRVAAVVVGGFLAALVSVWIYGQNVGPTLNPPFLEAAIFVLTATAFLPITVLLAYVLRIATVTRRTASTVPFTVRDGSPL